MILLLLIFFFFIIFSVIIINFIFDKPLINILQSKGITVLVFSGLIITQLYFLEKQHENCVLFFQFFTTFCLFFIFITKIKKSPNKALLKEDDEFIMILILAIMQISTSMVIANDDSTNNMYKLFANFLTVVLPIFGAFVIENKTDETTQQMNTVNNDTNSNDT